MAGYIGTQAVSVNTTSATISDDLTVGDDLLLTSDAAVLKIGNDADLQITHSGSAGTVTNATGDLTFDVAGDITLDADGADIRLSDAGTQFGKFTNSSSDFVISSSVNDKDMIFKGADGGADITALTLDMSDAGSAYFSNKMGIGTSTFVDTSKVQIEGAKTLSSGIPRGQLNISDGTAVATGVGGSINFSGNYSGTDKTTFGSIEGFKDNGTGGQYGGALVFKTRADQNDNIERMRLTSGGFLCVGTTASASSGMLAIDYARGSSAGMRIKDTVGSGGTGVIADFYNSSNNSMGAITHDSSNITYGGTSDYRLKENINYTWNGITKVKELKPARFTWIDNPDVGIIDGFLAHEVSSVVPKAVVGEKDASETYTDEDGNEQTKIIPQQLDQSKLVPLLTKALQEAIAKIETLEARITALEG
jgi:hypothetical protein